MTTRRYTHMIISPLKTCTSMLHGQLQMILTVLHYQYRGGGGGGCGGVSGITGYLAIQTLGLKKFM